ncbi:ice-binding family protein [Pontibacter pamirensis]|uniref:ice-binding family protein n=1 Tax=Pontibacter pamirensis TaxID=2562824 RepID=UPI001389987C|nr:ice-binding family protein [Pontibacter pamirensis]
MNRALLLVFFFLTLGVSLSLAQSDPALKRATTFTVLASTEIINNADRTGVTGNVGVHPGNSIIGEDRMSILQGRTEKGTAIAAAAQEDALAAYNHFLAQKDHDETKTLSSIIGTGTTLTPGVHKISGDLSLQGRLTLEGLGDDNSTFIIIVDGNLLSESPNASIIGQNGGHVKNLFWIISGEVRLGSISAMKGNMLAKRDITLAGVTVEGRAISLEGKVIFNGERNNLFLPSTIDPNLSVVKTAPARDYRVGDQITYTILVHNEGPGTATVVNMKERFPASLRYIPGSAVYTDGVFDESDYIWSLDFLQFGESREIELTFEILSAGRIVNTVIVESEEKDPQIEDNEDEVIIEVPEISSNLNVTKVAAGAPYYVGGNVTYTITVNNIGPYDAKAVTLTEVLPEGLGFVSATASQGAYDNITGLYTIGDLAVGSQATLTLVAKINAPGKIVNTVTVSPGGNVPDLTPGDNTGGEEIEATCVPVAAVEITGNLSLCEGITNAVFEATQVPGATYTFTVTGGLTKVSQTGNSITVSAGAASGTVEVSVTDLCGNTFTASKEIKVLNRLANPTIEGPAKVCQNSTGNAYRVADYGDDATYTWVATGGLQITAGENTPAVELSAGLAGGTLTLVVSNGCFTTTLVSKAITTTTLPNAPTAITGSATVCVGNQVTYSTAAVARADSYLWTVPAGWTVVSGEGTRTITLQVGNTPGNVDLSVAAANACGNTSAATIAVQVNETPAAPAAITGEITACAGTDVTYTVAAVAGATGYTWTPPTGWRIVSGGGTASVTYKVGAAGGNITVTADNGCGSSPVTTLAVTVNDKPATPGAITGPSAVCAEGTGNVYSVAAVDGATGYVWTVPDGWAVENGQNTTSITVTAGETAGAIKVKATNECGDSGERTYNSTISPVPAAPVAITGAATVCAGTEATYAVAAVAGATGYTWTLPAGWSIVSGEGTARVTVQVGTAAGAISVTADNNCGGSSAATLAVTVNDKLAAPAITGEVGACIGESLTYTIPAVTGATGYAWAVPATWTLVSGQNTTSIVVEVGEEAGQVTVGVINGCGTGNAATLNVAPVLAPTETNEIVGNSAVCEYGETVTYTLATVEDGVTYTWAVPANWALVSGQGTGTITVNTTATAGTVSVIATNTCGTAQSISKDVSITVPPVSPGVITDNSNVCDGLTYTINAVTGATGYTWTVPSGFTITSGQGTTTITVTADSPTAAGQVTVAALNGTCSGIAASATIDISLADGQLNFPKAFSPNGDGKNDTWVITNLEKFTANEVTIFNRWGSEVYKTRNYQSNWSASKLEPGTYFYKVRVTLCEGVVKEFTGYTTLFR